MFLQFLQTSFFHRPRDNKMAGYLGYTSCLFHISSYFPWNLKEGPRKDVIGAVPNLVYWNDSHELHGWEESSANPRTLDSLFCLLVIRNPPRSQGIWLYLGYGNSPCVVLMLPLMSECGILSVAAHLVWWFCWISWSCSCLRCEHRAGQKLLTTLGHVADGESLASG